MTLRERTTRGLLAGFGLLLAEAAWVLGLHRGSLTSVWEVQNGLLGILPVALSLAGVIGASGGGLLWLAERAQDRRFRLLFALLSGVMGGAAAWSVGGGRHLATAPVRGGFAAIALTFSALLAFAVAPALGRALARKTLVIAVVGLGLVINLELLNHRVLVRLYPGFHVSLAVLTCVTANLCFWVWGGAEPPGKVEPSAARSRQSCSGPIRGGGSLLSRVRAWAPLAALFACVAAGPASAKMLANFDNFRLLLVESAPLLGQAVRVAAVLAPPPPIVSACLDSSASVDCKGPTQAQGRSFSLAERDLLLVTIDATRADHLGAYGYGRRTSPNFDALANSGVKFEHAYAPTAHTSYSVTSMMTGKYMRPLLLQGAGASSDTWATLMQRYGVRTAAFYPPAVFFIDPAKFTGFQSRYLGFEYRKVEFLEGAARAEQVGSYLREQPANLRLFVWVHLFAPHEPYEKHPGFDFGDRDVDRYDSEIAFADDTLGRIVGEFRRLRPKSVVMVSADHGEEFGDHGGRYHGTTVYEEQVRVPLVVQAPDLFKPKTVTEPVQTIDLLPTVLAAMDVPRPPRIRGRDLGPLLVGTSPGNGPGLAMAETEEQLLLAEGKLRLLCLRQLGACKLYNLETDPGQTRDVSADFGESLANLRRRQRELSASHGQFEAEGLRAEGRGWPAAILRGITGDAEAADEIAVLLDDADVSIRRKAAQLLFELRRPTTQDALSLALGRDEDPEVRSWSALALTRLGSGAPLVFDLLASSDRSWKRLAALALAETGDKRGGEPLTDWWRDEKARDYVRSRELLVALGRIKCKDAVFPLIKSLGDVRLRPAIASALADIGDEAARGPLVSAFAEERYQGARVALGDALARLKAKEELARPLVRFLGVPDPLPNGLGLALRTGILEHVGGPGSRDVARLQRQSSLGVTVRVIIPKYGNNSGIRALLRVTNPSTSPGEVRLGLPAIPSGATSESPIETSGMKKEFRGGEFLSFAVPAGAKELELHAPVPKSIPVRKGLSLELRVLSTTAVRVDAVALVSFADEIPPPPPEPWEADRSVGGSTARPNKLP